MVLSWQCVTFVRRNKGWSHLLASFSCRRRSLTASCRSAIAFSCSRLVVSAAFSSSLRCLVRSALWCDLPASAVCRAVSAIVYHGTDSTSSLAVNDSTRSCNSLFSVCSLCDTVGPCETTRDSVATTDLSASDPSVHVQGESCHRKSAVVWPTAPGNHGCSLTRQHS